MEKFNQYLVDIVRAIDNRLLSEIEIDELDTLSNDLYQMVKMVDDEIAKKWDNLINKGE